jgi:hypothetical protein
MNCTGLPVTVSTRARMPFVTARRWVFGEFFEPARQARPGLVCVRAGRAACQQPGPHTTMMCCGRVQAPYPAELMARTRTQ